MSELNLDQCREALRAVAEYLVRSKMLFWLANASRDSHELAEAMQHQAGTWEARVATQVAALDPFIEACVDRAALQGVTQEEFEAQVHEVDFGIELG